MINVRGKSAFNLLKIFLNWHVALKSFVENSEILCYIGGTEPSLLTEVGLILNHCWSQVFNKHTLRTHISLTGHLTQTILSLRLYYEENTLQLKSTQNNQQDNSDHINTQ